MSKLEWIILAACLGLVWFKPGLGEHVFFKIDQKFSALAKNRRHAILAVGALAIVARIALLPWLHVPQPKVHDEFSYLLAGDTFAHGRLANPPHPLAAFFETFHVIQHPSYASMYPPGQGLALAIGEWLGHSWIGVLLSVAAMCMAFTWMLQGWVPEEWALLGGVLVWARFGVFSYWVNSYWGGAVAATGAALVMGTFARLRERNSARNALLLGLGAGILAISRPVEGSIFFAPVAATLVWWGFRCKDPARRPAIRRTILAPAALVLVCFGAFIGYYNHRVTGSVLVFPHFVEGKMITSPIFLWQKDKPQISYANSQFDDFYNNTLPGLYHASWPAAVGQLQYKATDFWEFFLGPALAIPFLALPWILRERRNRLLLVQVILSGLGLWIVVYYHAHYVAPLMATVFVLLMQCMRALQRVRILGTEFGVGLTRLVILYSLLIGPVYFAQSLVSQQNTFFVWLRGHTPLAFGLAFIALLLIHLAARRFRKAWLLPVLEFTLLVLFAVKLCELQRSFYVDAFPYTDDVNEPFRGPVEKQLAAIPGQHLVLVRYSTDHNSGEEYVYNEANIDRARIVWAREVPGMDLQPLLQYFHDRDLWLYEPDEDDSAARPYASDME